MGELINVKPEAAKVSESNHLQKVNSSQKEHLEDPFDTLNNDLKEFTNDVFDNQKLLINLDSQTKAPELIDWENGVHQLSENILDDTDNTLIKFEEAGISEGITNLFSNFSFEGFLKIISNFIGLIFSAEVIHQDKASLPIDNCLSENAEGSSIMAKPLVEEESARQE